VEEIPELRERLKEIPELRQQVEEIPELRERLKEIPELRQQVEEIPELRQQVKKIPELQERLKEIPELRQQVEEIPELREKLKDIPWLWQQVEEIPELRERTQELEDESRKTHGVATKGRCAAFRELIQWGMKQDTVVYKAYNRKIAAPGQRKIRVGHVRHEASIIVPFLHMELHVSDMLDWQAALASIPGNLASNYSVSMCLAETAFEEVFGFHPTNSGSGIFQNEQCGKSNDNLASSLIWY
jgi:Rad3-related DNA helicase